MTDVEIVMVTNAIASLQFKRLLCPFPTLRARLEYAILESERALSHAIVADARRSAG